MDLLDTDVLIDVQRRHPPAIAWFSGLTVLPAVPGFVVMELVQDARNAAEVAAALKLVAPLDIVWPTESDHAFGLANFASYHLSHGLGLLDALIASCAVGRNATLCTFNTKHFQVVPGLTTIQPYTR
jgi:predicted nucleic acid-binding protein